VEPNREGAKVVKVFLREKRISRGRRSLYLDFYPPIIHPETGKLTRREFLSLYTLDRPKIDPQRDLNNETRKLGETIRARRQIEIQAGNYSFLLRKTKDRSFLVFFNDLAGQRKASKSNYENWLCVYHHLVKFTNGTCTFGMINEGFIKEFRDYLQFRTDLSRNSAQTYFGKFKAAIRIAFESKHLEENFALRVKRITPEETQREFLSLEELQSLASTECDVPELKRAALFSALTGLRFSDIAKLLWAEVQYSEMEGHLLRFRQQKTGGVETLPISEQAYRLLGETGEPAQRVFDDLVYSQTLNRRLAVWVKKAGIKKSITFHCFRHSFATIQLSLGTDIYVVSKLLGHRELKTTQIYAKIIDGSKREAVGRLRLEL